MDATTESQADIIANSAYGYIPTLYICAIYVSLFGLATLLHLGLAVRSRLWWLLPTLVAGGLTETIGWSGRLWSAKNPDDIDPYLMQITTTIIAPSFMTAANFLILGIIISRLGPQYSRLSPRWYSIIFITADVVALVVQAVGGGLAATAVQADPPQDPENGAHIMLGGICWQMAAITAYALLALEFFIRVRLDKPVRSVDFAVAQAQPVHTGGGKFSLHGTYNPRSAEREAYKLQTVGFGFAQGSKLSLMILALGLSTVLIYIRSIYRTIELVDGWTGTVITTEWYFNVFDACPITLALFTMIFLHPGFLLYEPPTASSEESTIELNTYNPADA